MTDILFKNNDPYKKQRLTRAVLFALILVLIDQGSKFAITEQFTYAERLNLFYQWNIGFDLILVYNTGAAFSFLSNAGGWQTYAFLTLAIAVSLFLFVSIYKNNQPLATFYMTLIAGGALGNAIDRVIHGKVIDFLLCYYKDWYYPAFNAADIFICMGIFFFVVDEFFIKRGK